MMGTELRLNMIRSGHEDRLFYEITETCIQCGTCKEACPVQAVTFGNDRYRIDPARCIDCGTCAAVCPSGAAAPVLGAREGISVTDINMEKCYFNPGCAMSLYKPDVPEKMLSLLRRYFGEVKMHSVCCRHDPRLPSDSTIINNCAGCDRRFRSLYDGINTISFWEVLGSIPSLPLPDYKGLTVSVHDSCGYRHKPQVHAAVRSLLAKMNIHIIESDFSGTESVCCGDNFYGHAENHEVEQRIRMRAEQMPCENVVVYCIGCLRAMESAGKKPYYLPDLILNRRTEPMPDSLDEYHHKLEEYIERH